MVEKYGEVLVSFHNYYEYLFTYKSELEDGRSILAYVGGDSDDIYRLSVNTDPIYVAKLYPDNLIVRDTNEIVVEQYYC